MSREIQNVVVAGPNGSLGHGVVKHLKENGFNITLLTRSLEKTKSAFPGLATVDANYDSTEQLTKALQQIERRPDTVVILINREEDQAQINLIDAAIAVGIPHIIPSAFGFTTTHPIVRSYPALAAKARMEDHLVQKASEGRLTYTQVQVCAFFDWALDRGVYLNTIDPAAGTTVFDGGDVPFSATNVDDIGRAIAGSLLNVDRLKNRDVHVHTAVVTQNQLLEYAREAAPDKEFKVIDVDTAELEKQAFEKYNSGDRSQKNMRSFIIRVVFGKGIGWFKTTDNELLGVKQWNDAQVKEFVAGYFKK